MAEWRSTHFVEASQPAGSSPEFQLADDASRATRVIRVAYDHLDDAVLDFIGYSYVGSDGPGGARVIHRVNPHGLPMFQFFGQDQPWLFCTTIQRGRPISVLDHDDQLPRGGIARGKWWELTLGYNSLLYDILEDDDPRMRFFKEGGGPGPLGDKPDEATLQRYVTRKWAPFGRVISIGHSLMRYVPEDGDSEYEGDGSGIGPPIKEGIGKGESGVIVSYTHHLRPDVPYTTLQQALSSRVNSVTFDGFPPETLLLENAEVMPVRRANGTLQHNLMLHFKALFKVKKSGTICGWNHILRIFTRDGGKVLDYRKVSSTGLEEEFAGIFVKQGDYAYGEYDFYRLFRPE